MGQEQGWQKGHLGPECHAKEGGREDLSWWQWWAPCEGPKDVSDMFTAMSERGQGTVGRDEGRASLKGDQLGVSCKSPEARQQRRKGTVKPEQHRFEERLRQ